MSDDRDDVTPEPGDGSDTGDSAASPAADDMRTEESAAHGSESELNPDESASQGTTAAARPSGKRRGPARSSRKPTGEDANLAARPGVKGRATPSRSKQEAPSKGNPVGRIIRYLREVAAELRKVIWPTRKELITYTAVVLVFVAFMVALTSGLDLAFARGVLLVFG
ncbi:MAG: preprotein translocase subunit SecE [Mycobacteriaceae bacterium]